MLAPAEDAEIEQRLRASAETSAARAPLNAALTTIIADDPTLRALFGTAPPTQRLPVLLLAAIHDRVLAAPATALAAWYATVVDVPRSPDDPALRDVLTGFVDEHRAEIVDALAHRTVQTNEVGRCALFLPALSLLAAELQSDADDTGTGRGGLGHLDVGASAGLLLGVDRYRYRYSPGGDVGPQDAPVLLECGTRGPFPVPEIPRIVARRGLDVAPVDVNDQAAMRWLEACVWPDQRDRFERLAAAIELMRHDPPRIDIGPAEDVLEDVLDDLLENPDVESADRAHPVVTTSWVLNYLEPDRQRCFTAALDRAGRDRDLSWVIAEAPAMTTEIPAAAEWRDSYRTAVTLVRWRNGRRSVHPLALAHPHGYWMHWRDDAPRRGRDLSRSAAR